jgi:mono/diheme cytochrome c family protein
VIGSGQLRWLVSHWPSELIVLIVLILSFVLASAQMRNLAHPPIRPLDGATIFRNYCAPCHGLDGRGKGPVSGALRDVVPDLTTLSERHGNTFPVAHVRNTIMFGNDEVMRAHGSEQMPIWGPVFHEIEFDQDLGNVRLENVTKYLESIQRK